MIAFFAFLLLPCSASGAAYAHDGVPDRFAGLAERHLPADGETFWGREILQAEAHRVFAADYQGRGAMLAFYSLKLDTGQKGLLARIIPVDGGLAASLEIMAVGDRFGEVKAQAAFFVDLDRDGGEELVIAVALRSESYQVMEVLVFGGQEEDGKFAANSGLAGRLGVLPRVLRLSGGAGGAPSSYTDEFVLDELRRLYLRSADRRLFVRPYLGGLRRHYGAGGWPLPECRVNEWACLVNLEMTREHVAPRGPLPPFGAFEQCGRLCLDTSVPWFRELSRLGLKARNMDIAPLVTHWIGTAKMTAYKYLKAEGNARRILQKHFPEYVEWCRARGNKMF